MKPWVIVPAAAGVALLAVGVVAAQKGGFLKADEALPAPPLDPGVLPQHTRAGQTKATYCQLISAYRVDLAVAESKVTEAQRRMDQIENEARGVCNVYAETPEHQYHCNGFPVCSWNEWYTVSGTTTDQEAKTLCMSYARGDASALPLRKHSPWADDENLEIAHINDEIETAWHQVQDLRQRYLAAKRGLKEAKAKVADLVKKIKDLQAQGVECGLA